MSINASIVLENIKVSCSRYSIKGIASLVEIANDKGKVTVGGMTTHIKEIVSVKIDFDEMIIKAR